MAVGTPVAESGGGGMRVGAAADLHGNLPTVEPCDVLALAGDLVPPDLELSPADSRRWLDREFRAWLEQVPARHVIAIAGNHDLVCLEPHLLPDLPWIYLQDEGTTVAGLRAWGTPWSPPFMGGAFEAPRSGRRVAFSLIPDDLDLLLTHTPPHGYGDRASRPGLVDPPVGHRRNYEHVGCSELLAALRRAHPRLVVYGHVHEDRGYRGTLGSGAEATRLANVCLLGSYYEPRRRPTYFEL